MCLLQGSVYCAAALDLWNMSRHRDTHEPQSKFLAFFFFFFLTLVWILSLLRYGECTLFYLRPTREAGVFLFKLKCYWFAVVHDSHMSWLLGFVSSQVPKIICFTSCLAGSSWNRCSYIRVAARNPNSRFSCTFKKCVLFINTVLGICICVISP